jgi:hypothetical protein
LSIDFTTLITRIKQQLADSEVFQDYNYEGSNIAILIELLAYTGELNTYLLNKVAKNVHIESADIYEAVNRNSRMMGYEPKGSISSRGTVTVSVTGSTPGHQYLLNQFTQMECPDETDDDGNTIKYANVLSYTLEPTGSNMLFNIETKQGEVAELTGYKGSDLVDNQLLLPSNYAYDNDLDDEYPSLEVTVDDLKWTRVSDFYDELSALKTEDDVYMFIFDKYERAKLIFNSARNVPAADSAIALTILASLGSKGNVARGAITGIPTQFIYDNTNDTWLDPATTTITNDDPTTGGTDKESIASIKTNAQAGLRSQFRNVTSSDFQASLETRSDVIQGNAWGEQDVAPSGSVQEFNKVYLSVIPDDWDTRTINVTYEPWTTSWDTSAAIMIPSAYNPLYERDLKQYIEPRKMISTYEIFKLPRLVYISFEFGVRKKRTYDFDKISTDLKNKLIYYFRPEAQNFGSIINFNNIVEYLLDTNEVSADDTFNNIKGIRNLNLRDIETNVDINENNIVGDYPYYIELSTAYEGENQLRRIQLGPRQFPILSEETVTVSEEN